MKIGAPCRHLNSGRALHTEKLHKALQVNRPQGSLCEPPARSAAIITGSARPFPSDIEEIQQRLAHLSEAVTADRENFSAAELQILLPEPVNKGQIDQDSPVAVDEL